MEGYYRYRIENQAKQILNCADNFNLDKLNLFDVVMKYNNILESKSETFSESLIRSANLLKSQYLEEYDKYINEGLSLENNNSDSFLIFPMFSGNHAFYGILRKIHCEYSYTIINRGERLFHKKYEEYIIYDIEKCIRFLKEISVQNSRNIEDIYQNILALSKDNKVNLIRVDSVAQKVGNCFIKELESAVKYAYSTRNGNENNVDLIKLRKSECFLHRPKWNVSTLEMHGRYIEKLKEENFNLAVSLNDIYKAYTINKVIRKDKGRLSLKNVINKIFVNSHAPIEEFLKNVDINNFMNLTKQIDAIITDKLQNKYRKLKIMCANLVFKNTTKLLTNEDFLELNADFTNVSSQLKEQYANFYFKEANYSRKLNCFEYGQTLVEYSLNLLPFNSKAYILRIKFMDRVQLFIERCINDCDKAIFMEPTVVSNYVEKAKLLELAGRYYEYEEILLNIRKLGKLTKNMCRNVADIFELKGDLKRALKWTQIAISLDSRDKKFIDKEKILMQKIDNMFDIDMRKKMAVKCEIETEPYEMKENSRERRGMII